MFADSYINYAFSIIFVPFAPFFLFFRYFFVRSVHPFLCFFQHQLHFICPFCQKCTFFLHIYLLFLSLLSSEPPFYAKKTLSGNMFFIVRSISSFKSRRILIFSLPSPMIMV